MAGYCPVSRWISYRFSTNTRIILIIGFVGFIRTISGTGDTPAACLDASRPSHVYTSPGEIGFIDVSGNPNVYTVYAYCAWVIQTNVYNHVVSLTVTTNFGGTGPQVSVYDGSNGFSRRLLQAFGTSSYTLTSSGQSLYIVFKSYGSNTRKSFRFKYRAVPKTSIIVTNAPYTTSTRAPSARDAFGACSSLSRPRILKIYKGQTGFIESPDYPNKYPNRANCAWLLQASSGDYAVLLDKVFISLESGMDVLKVYDSTSYYGQIFSSDSSSAVMPLVSSGQSMYIEFKSDLDTQYAGFRLNYSAVPKSLYSTRTTQRTRVVPYSQDKFRGDNSLAGTIAPKVLGTLAIVFVFVIVFYIRYCRRRPTPPAHRIDVPPTNTSDFYNNDRMQSESRDNASIQLDNVGITTPVLHPFIYSGDLALQTSFNQFYANPNQQSTMDIQSAPYPVPRISPTDVSNCVQSGDVPAGGFTV